MTYTFINSAALAFDLVRRPHGSTAAAILLAALTATTSQLSAITDARDRPGSDRTRPSRSGDHRGPGTSHLSSPHGAVLGDASGLTRLVGDEVLGPGTAAAGLRPSTRSTVAHIISSALVRAVAAPAGAATDLLPHWASRPPEGSDTGPHTRQLHRFLDRVASATTHDRDRWRQATTDALSSEVLSGPSWAEAAHQASWAVHLTGRSRAHALTQLFTVQAYRAGRFTIADTHAGTWNEISGTTMAILTSDLLSADANRRLTRTHPPIGPRRTDSP